MKSKANRIVIALLITAMTSFLAFAKSKKETVTFLSNMQVNGTLVKKGTYIVKFDEQTSELSILDGSKVLAKSMVRVEKRDRKAKAFELRSTGKGTETQLVSVTFAGTDQNIILNQRAGEAASNE